jgi:hypothetical protein
MLRRVESAFPQNNKGGTAMMRADTRIGGILAQIQAGPVYIGRYRKLALSPIPASVGTPTYDADVSLW